MQFISKIHPFTNAYLRSTRNSIYLIDTHKNSDQTNLAVHYRSTNELGCIQAVGMNPSTSSSSWLLHNEYSDRPGFRRGISCDPTGSNGDSGAARAVLNTFNPNKDVFISRDNVISGLANLKKCVGGACPRFGNPQSVADLIFHNCLCIRCWWC